MILVVFGTTGELIKLAPVLLRLDERSHPYLLATTGQQVQQIPGFLEQFGLRQPDLWLARGAGGRDLRVNSDIPGWAARVVRSWLRERRRVLRVLRDGPGRPLAPGSRGHDDDGARQRRSAGRCAPRSRTSKAACAATTCAILSRRSSTERLQPRSAGSTTRRVPGPRPTCGAARSWTRARTRFATAWSSCPTSRRP